MLVIVVLNIAQDMTLRYCAGFHVACDMSLPCDDLLVGGVRFEGFGVKVYFELYIWVVNQFMRRDIVIITLV